jgi:hypothetical protein
MVTDAIPYANLIPYIVGLIITGIIVYISTSVALRSWQQSAGSGFLVTLIGYIIYLIINTLISSTSSNALLIKAGIAFIVWLYLVKKIYGDIISWEQAFAIAIFITIFISAASFILPMFFRI